MSGNDAYFASALCCLLEVDSLYCDARRCTVISQYYCCIELQSNQTGHSDNTTVAGRTMSSTADYLWSFCADQSGLDWKIEENHSLSCSLEIRAADQDVLKPVLIIGKQVEFRGSTVDVAQVIAVDILSAIDSQDELHLCLLVQCGTVVEESATNSSHSVSSRVPKQFSLVFAKMRDGTPAITCICTLNDVLLFDQTPTHVRCIAPHLAVMSGTNGLLALVKSDSFGSNTAELLVEDSMWPEPPRDCVLSHRGDVAITAVDCERVAGTDGCDLTLVSGDSDGTVCVWRVNSASGSGYLLHKPYCVECEARRVLSLHLSPSGCEVAVGLLDRLLLLHYRSNDQGECSTSCESVDTLDGIHAMYGVVFEEEYMRMWRVTDQASTNAPGICIATWLHDYNIQSTAESSDDNPMVIANVDTATPNSLYAVVAQATAVTSDLPPPVAAQPLLPAVSEAQLSVVSDVIIDHHAQHASHFALFGMHRVESLSEQRTKQNTIHLERVFALYKHEHTAEFVRAKPVIAVLCALHAPPSLNLIAAVLHCAADEVLETVRLCLSSIIDINQLDSTRVVCENNTFAGLLDWLCSMDCDRVGAQFWIDPAVGHNFIAALYIRVTSHSLHAATIQLGEEDLRYLRTFGQTHVQQASRGLRLQTTFI